MASVRREVDVAVSADRVWAAIRDVGAVHRRLLPGRVSNAFLDGDNRILTFPDGHRVRELILTIDDEARRLAYAVIEGARPPLTHHHATFEVLARDETNSRLVWVTDLLPHDAAVEVALRMQVGVLEMRRTLESQAGR